MPVETSLVLIKPDGVERRLVGEVISRLERKGLTIAAMKLVKMAPDLADKHYEAHVEKPFYPELKQFMTRSPLVALAVKGEGAIAHIRNIMGATKPQDATPGSIRGDYCTTVTENVVHGSDSKESADRELALWFTKDELVG